MSGWGRSDPGRSRLVEWAPAPRGSAPGWAPPRPAPGPARRRGVPLRVMVALLGLALAAGVAGDRVYLAQRAGRPLAAPAGAAAQGAQVQLPAAGRAITPYEVAIDAAARRGLRVWLEADLVKRWLAGRTEFDAGVRQLARLARRPGVIGIKIADELGRGDGLRTPVQVLAFLRDSRAALRTLAPGKSIMIDIVVPELGCLPGELLQPLWATVCGVRARARYPALALAQVDRYLSSGYVDTVNLSTSLYPDRTYAGWGTTRDEAQRAAWAEVARRGWADQVRIRARKALAHPGVDRRSSAELRRDVATYVDAPLRYGAEAVDIWTWRQGYGGQTMRLLDPGLRPNRLWAELRARKARGDQLFTHFTPTSTELGISQDLDVLAQVFADVLVAAGTG